MWDPDPNSSVSDQNREEEIGIALHRLPSYLVRPPLPRPLPLASVELKEILDQAPASDWFDEDYNVDEIQRI